MEGLTERSHVRRLSLVAALCVGCSGGSGGSSTLTGPDAFPVTYTVVVAVKTDGGIGTFEAALADADLSADFVPAVVCARTPVSPSVDARVVSLGIKGVGASPPPLVVGTPYPSQSIYLDELFADGGSVQLAGQGSSTGTITLTALSTSQVAGSFNASLTTEDGGVLALGGTFSAAPIVCN